MEEGLHHDAVAVLEDLERDGCSWEEDEGEREERELDEVVGFGRVGVVVVLLGEGGGRASEGG